MEERRSMEQRAVRGIKCLSVPIKYFFELKVPGAQIHKRMAGALQCLGHLRMITSSSAIYFDRAVTTLVPLHGTLVTDK